MPDLSPNPAEGMPDPAVARAERRLRLLEELTEIGMELARKLRDDAGEYDHNGRDPADAFARVSRAVRLTISLEAKTDQELRALQAGAPPAPQGAPAASRVDHRAVHKAQMNERKANALDLLFAVAETETEGLEDFETLMEALVERPGDSDAGPIKTADDMLVRLCQGLGLTPELSRKVGEGFYVGYLCRRPRWNPNRRTAPSPVRWDDDPPPDAGPSAVRAHPRE
jgi:hypothetical protein